MRGPAARSLGPTRAVHRHGDGREDHQRRAPRRFGRAHRVWGAVLAVLSGVGLAVQSRLNGQLGEELHDPVLASVISFGGGLLILLLLCWSRRLRTATARAVAAGRVGTLRPWHFLGGIAGALLTLGQSITVTVIGVAMFTVGVVAGQSVSGLFVDRAGLGPAGANALTVLRVAGALLTVLAVGIALVGDFALTDPKQVWLLGLPLLAGSGMALQQAFNGHVQVTSGSSLAAALVNFTIGTLVLIPVWLASVAVRGGPTAWPADAVLYLGGPIGVAVIATASLIVSWIGVLLLGLASVSGQLIGSVLLDVVVPAAGHGPDPATILGCTVALAAVVIASMGGRGSRGVPQSSS